MLSAVKRMSCSLEGLCDWTNLVEHRQPPGWRSWYTCKCLLLDAFSWEARCYVTCGAMVMSIRT